MTFAFSCSTMLMLVLLALPGLAVAAPTSTGGEVSVEQPLPPRPAPGGPVLPGAARLQSLHDYVSRNVELLAWKVDSFFGATRVYEEYQGNYVQMRGSVIVGRGGKIDYDGNLRAKLDLPNLEEKVNLVFESESASQPNEGRITTPTGNTPLNTVNDKSLNAALQFILQQKKRWDIRLQPGIKLRLPLDPFIRGRFRYLAPFGEVWLSRFTLTPGWYNSRGWESRARLDLERATGNESLLRSSSEVIWQLDHPRNLLLTQSFLLAHPLGPLAQMAYEAGVTAQIDPKFEDTSWFASIRYRRNIHQGWIFFEVKPQVVFAREDHFRADPALVLTLEMLFGQQTL